MVQFLLCGKHAAAEGACLVGVEICQVGIDGRVVHDKTKTIVLQGVFLHEEGGERGEIVVGACRGRLASRLSESEAPRHIADGGVVLPAHISLLFANIETVQEDGVVVLAADKNALAGEVIHSVEEVVADGGERHAEHDRLQVRVRLGVETTHVEVGSPESGRVGVRVENRYSVPGEEGVLSIERQLFGFGPLVHQFGA